MTDERFFPPRNFAALPPEHSDYARSRVVVLPVPYDSTASGWVGSREGPAAIIDASANMELYDIGIGSEPYRVGIHTLPELAFHAGGPEAMMDRIEEVVGEQLDGGKFVVTLGGEHTVAVGAVRAHAKRTGVVYIGGGTPKNFIQQAEVAAYIYNRELPGHKYGIQITMDQPQWGGLSGCTFEEAQSWRKIAPDADFVTANVEASVALPIIVSALAEELGDSLKSRTLPTLDFGPSAQSQ